MSQVLTVPRVGQKADLDHPINKDLFTWLPMNQGFQDIAQNNRNVASVEGDISFWSRSVGYTANFDGNNDALILPYGVAHGQSKITVTAWFRINDISSTRNIYVESLDATGKARIDTAIITGGTLRISGRRSDGDLFTTFCLSDTGLVPAASSLNGPFYFGAWVYDCKNTHKVYLNGKDVTVSADVVDDPFDNNLPYEVTIGANGPRSARFQGDMQNVRVWNRALSDNEVIQLYQDPWVGIVKPSTIKYFLPLATVSSTPRLNLKCKMSINNVRVRI